MTENTRNRSPRYLQQTSSNQERWMVSYTDVVTILLILFIAVAVQATQGKPEPPRPARAPAPHRPVPAPALSLAQSILQKHGIAIKMEQRGLVITLPQAVLFPSGEDSVRAEALPLIEEIAGVLRTLDNKVLLIGHTDTTPIHNQYFGSNWELSAARSIQLLTVLTEQFGLPEARFTIASDASNNPAGPNDSEAGRARNRRVEIVILDDALSQSL